MKSQQRSVDVKSEAPRLTLSHRCQNGQIFTFKMWRGYFEVQAIPDATIIPVDWQEYYRWWGYVLARHVESQNPKREVVESKVFYDDEGHPTGWHLEMKNGFRLEVEIPHPLVFEITMTKRGVDISTDIGGIQWAARIVNLFLLRRNV